MKERNGVALEASRSLRAYKWPVVVTRDYMRCPRCGAQLFPDAAPGCFDLRMAVPLWDKRDMDWRAIEVKSKRTALPFSELDEKKRIWSAEHTDDYSMWLWVCLGERINHRKYPRTTYLFPLWLFYELEQTLERKSIPYGHPSLEGYTLTWEGKGLWAIPESHPFL